MLAGVAVFSVAGFAQDNKAATPEADKAEKHMKGEGKRWGKGHGRGHGMGRGMRGFFGIELTDAQKEQMRVIRENNKPDETVMTEMKTLRDAKRAGTITAEQTERMKAIREQMHAKHKAVREQMFAVLTPEQKAQIEAKKAEMKQRREEFRKQRELRKQQKAAETAKPVEG